MLSVIFQIISWLLTKGNFIPDIERHTKSFHSLCSGELEEFYCVDSTVHTGQDTESPSSILATVSYVFWLSCYNTSMDSKSIIELIILWMWHKTKQNKNKKQTTKSPQWLQRSKDCAPKAMTPYKTRWCHQQEDTGYVTFPRKENRNTLLNCCLFLFLF